MDNQQTWTELRNYIIMYMKVLPSSLASQHSWKLKIVTQDINVTLQAEMDLDEIK